MPVHSHQRPAEFDERANKGFGWSKDAHQDSENSVKKNLLATLHLRHGAQRTSLRSLKQTTREWPFEFQRRGPRSTNGVTVSLKLVRLSMKRWKRRYKNLQLSKCSMLN